MKLTQSYVEYLKRTYGRTRSYPVASMEILLLDQAQQRQRQREKELFQELSTIFDWRVHRNYNEALAEGYTLVVTDTDKSILWASDRFLSMTGYKPTEAIGQTPAFLQGVGTDRLALREISRQLEQAAMTHRIRPIRERLLNYRKNGESYWCDIEIDPLWNHQGELTHFVAVEKEVRGVDDAMTKGR